MPERSVRPGLRVLVVTNVGPSTVSAYLGPLAALQEVAEVTLLRDRPNVDLGPKVRVVVPPAWCLRNTASRLLARALLLRHEAAHGTPDLMMVLHWFPDGAGALRVATRLDVPLVANIIGSRAELVSGGRKLALSAMPTFMKQWAERYQCAKLNQTTVVTSTGSRTLESLRELGVRSPKLSVLHSAMSMAVAAPAVQARDLDVAYVGRSDPDKRADRFLRIIAEVGRRRPGTTATMIGVSEREAEELPDYSPARAALGEGLRLLGLVPFGEVARELCRAKLLLVTSDSEGRPLAALEAMLGGAVPIATDVGDVREALDNGRAGLVVPLVGNEEELVATMADAAYRLLNDEGTRSAISRYALTFVRREHDPVRTQEEWRSVIGAALHGRRGDIGS